MGELSKGKDSPTDSGKLNFLQMDDPLLEDGQNKYTQAILSRNLLFFGGEVRIFRQLILLPGLRNRRGKGAQEKVQKVVIFNSKTYMYPINFIIQPHNKIYITYIMSKGFMKIAILEV